MADPTPYIVKYSFSDFQSNSPTAPPPGSSLDNEFANAATAIAALVSSMQDVRRADGALNDGIVTFNSLSSALKLTVDPTNGQQVAAAVAGAQASATAASGSATAAATSATNSANSAAAAATSASSVNLALYLPKAGNLAGIGSADTARANINAAARDGSDMTGRVAPVTGSTVTDWNAVLSSGWYSGFNAANAPFAGDALVETIAFSSLWITQIAYPFTNAATSVSAVTPFRRHSFNNGGVIAWQPWESFAPVPVGSTIWINGTTAPPGFIKENGALISRASFPALYAYAAASGNIVSEASWSGGNIGAFSTGDLSTTFRVPDARGLFIRGYDDGAGRDSGRVLGANQADSLKDHTHTYQLPVAGAQKPNSGGTAPYDSTTPAATGSPSTGAAAETRPKNNAKLACIKY